MIDDGGDGFSRVGLTIGMIHQRILRIFEYSLFAL